MEGRPEHLVRGRGRRGRVGARRGPENFLKTANRLVTDYGIGRLAGGTRKTFFRWLAAKFVATKDDVLVAELAKTKNFKEFMETYGSKKKSVAKPKPAAKEESEEDEEDEEEDGEEDEEDGDEEEEEEGGAAKVRDLTHTFRTGSTLTRFHSLRRR